MTLLNIRVFALLPLGAIRLFSKNRTKTYHNAWLDFCYKNISKLFRVKISRPGIFALYNFVLSPKTAFGNALFFTGRLWLGVLGEQQLRPQGHCRPKYPGLQHYGAEDIQPWRCQGLVPVKLLQISAGRADVTRQVKMTQKNNLKRAVDREAFRPILGVLPTRPSPDVKRARNWMHEWANVLLRKLCLGALPMLCRKTSLWFHRCQISPFDFVVIELNQTWETFAKPNLPKSLHYELVWIMIAASPLCMLIACLQRMRFCVKRNRNRPLTMKQ